MKITALVACDTNLGIAKNNKIPWNIPLDQRLFQAFTKGGVCIVGRNTYLTLPPLKDRTLLIYTKKVNSYNEFSDTKECIETAKNYNKPIFIIGGAITYRAFLPYTDKFLVSHVLGNFNCDIKLDDHILNDFDEMGKIDFDTWELQDWVHV